jgi:hypothetical protein
MSGASPPQTPPSLQPSVTRRESLPFRKLLSQLLTPASRPGHIWDKLHRRKNEHNVVKGRLLMRGEFEGGGSPASCGINKDLRPGRAMRCESDFRLVAAEHTTRGSFIEDQISDSQFIALASRRSLLIPHEWGSAPSISPVAAVFRFSKRMASVPEVSWDHLSLAPLRGSGRNIVEEKEHNVVKGRLLMRGEFEGGGSPASCGINKGPPARSRDAMPVRFPLGRSGAHDARQYLRGPSFGQPIHRPGFPKVLIDPT